MRTRFTNVDSWLRARRRVSDTAPLELYYEGSLGRQLTVLLMGVIGGCTWDDVMGATRGM